MASAGVTPDPVALIRALWDAMRDRDVEAALVLMHPEVEWVPLIDEGASVWGTDALRVHLEALAGAGVVAAAYPLDYEALDDGRVLMSGALRVRRPDHWLATLQRWWIYVVDDDLIRRAQACKTREEAIASPGAG